MLSKPINRAIYFKGNHDLDMLEAIISIHIVIYNQPEHILFNLFLCNELIDYLCFNFFCKLNYIAINVLYNLFLCVEQVT